jgi:16S rRNA (guanine966-N2)-methyltransferase
MRIIGGAWRGRRLVGPPGDATRPTADRVRQALFDRLLHAPWAGQETVEGATVLDAFAGTGALGLEALSRGAAEAVFLEHDRDALAALRANIAACRAEARCRVLAADALRPPPGRACDLVFMDPPYGQDLVPRAAAALAASGWIGPGALVIAELGRGDTLPALPIAAEWAHGAARMAAWRMASPRPKSS